MQALAGGIQHDLADILAQHEADLVLRAGLGQNRGMMLVHQALDHSLFDDALAGRHAGELAVQGRAGHREGGIGGQQLFPGDAVHAVKQLIEGGSGVGVEEQHHALHRAQVQVGGSDHLRPARKGQAAIPYPDVLGPDAGQLKFRSCFAAKEAGCDQFKFCRHSGSFLVRGRCRTTKNRPAPLGQARFVLWLSGRGGSAVHNRRRGGCWSRGRGRPSFPRSGS